MIRSLFSPFLLLFSGMYFCLICIRNFLFDFGILKIKKLDVPVISVGNVSVGGSGKTALVLEILDQIPNLGVLTRGYKSQALKTKKVPCLVESSQDPDFYGDEPSLIKSKYPETTIVIDSDRYRGGLFAQSQNNKIRGFVLDDGFQHRKLFRDLNILVFDLDIYLKKPGLLPFGSFRETISALKRADMILVSKWNHLSEAKLSQVILKLKKYNENIDLLDSKIENVKNSKNEMKVNGRCLLVSGLGQPDVFEADLRRDYSSLEIIEHMKYPDHYKYTVDDLRGLFMIAQKLDAALVCSEKDYIKFKPLGLNLDLIYFTVQKIKLTEKCINKILKVIETKPS